MLREGRLCLVLVVKAVSTLSPDRRLPRLKVRHARLLAEGSALHTRRVRRWPGVRRRPSVVEAARSLVERDGSPAVHRRTLRDWRTSAALLFGQRTLVPRGGSLHHNVTVSQSFSSGSRECSVLHGSTAWDPHSRVAMRDSRGEARRSRIRPGGAAAVGESDRETGGELTDGKDGD